MTECLKKVASDEVARRTGTVKAVIETVASRYRRGREDRQDDADAFVPFVASQVPGPV